MQMTLDMSSVQACGATACAYNVDRNCRARAITVGDGMHPACDTFFVSDRHTRDEPHTAGVGACKVSACRYNSEFECSAETIQISVHGTHADCATFASR